MRISHSPGRACALLVALFLLIGCGGSSTADYSRASAYRNQTVARAAPPSGPAIGGVSSGAGPTDWTDREVSGELRERRELETAQAEPVEATESPPTPQAPDDEVPAPPTERLIIYTASVALYVLDVVLALERTTTFAESLGGWMQASTSTSLTLRVPAERFEAFVDGLADIGRITDRNVVGVDVTEEYYDLEIRLANAIELRARLTELLARATTVEETLAIERELARVTTEIETLKGRARYLRENAAFSTVTVSFYEDPSQLPAGSRVQLPFDWLTRYSLERLYQTGTYH